MPRRLRALAVFATTCLLSAAAAASVAPAASANSSSSTCAAVVTIAARGTTKGSDTSLGMIGTLASAIQNKTSKANRIYNLPYKSTTTDFLDASYNEDVSGGETALRNYLNSTYDTCKTKTDFVLIGWSKGANVVMDTIDDLGPQLSSSVRARIKAVVVYGDPTFNVGMSFDRGTYNPDASSLSPSIASFSTFGDSRIRSYCDNGDAVCQSNLLFGWDIHSGYFSKYNATAASFVVSKLGS